MTKARLAIVVIMLFGVVACGGSEEPGLLQATDDECRESAVVDTASASWQLVEPAPQAWKGGFPVEGVIRVQALRNRAVFIGPDGEELQLLPADAPTEDLCTQWE